METASFHLVAQVHRAVDVIMYSIGSGRRETAMSSVHHGWFSDNKEWIEFIGSDRGSVVCLI